MESLVASVEQEILTIMTSGRGIIDISDKISSIVKSAKLNKGICHLFCQHTSASLIITENYDSDVKVDIETFLSQLVKDGDPDFTHRLEGDDDMAAHIRSVLTASSLSIPIIDGRLGLGQWQGVCLYEHRYQPHRRNIVLSMIGS
jgi:secondary thiamine-phosphate synthase enzyme